MPATPRRLPTLSPLAAYLLSPALVALTTWLLLLIQSAVSRPDGENVRPFGIGFLAAVALITIAAGRGPGLLTLVLSALSLMLFLSPRGVAATLEGPSDWAELVFLLSVGGLLTLGLEALRQNSQVLAESEEARARLSAVMDTAPVGVLLSDPQGKLAYANREAERIWGHPLEAVGREGWGRYHMLNADGTPTRPEQTGLARALAGEGPLIQDERIIEQPDGARVYVQTNSTLVRDTGGRVLSGLVVFSDITARKRAEQRDHAIALALQDALMPALPERVPGLAMASYYKAALEEANVGGDFLDVFSLDKGQIVFAVGDLSGKGLAAASQVATVRNMLRYSLYRSPRLDLAVSDLNATVVEYDLLSGFATLFVGIYDQGARTLTYVSCGHDPGLVRRAKTGETELLPPGGTDISPVLGLAEDALFVQQTAILQRGDTLFLCTDGITEAGRSRGEFLGVAGVAQMLQGGPPGESVEDLVARIVAEVKVYARGIQHDDVCLLAAIVG